MTLDSLNPEQREAVTTTEGPLLVIAGAGSGKTSVIVHRIAHIAEQGRAHPSQILAVTFTRKAAAEMKTRLADMLGPEAGSAWIGTFHSMCARLMRGFVDLFGFTGSFSIYDEQQSERMLKASLAAVFPNKEIPSIGAIAAEIERAKNRGVTPQVLAQLEPRRFAPFAPWAQGVSASYQENLRRANAMDYGDILLFFKRLLRDYPMARARIAGRFRYVLVDEFQDTNQVQLEIVQSLVAAHQNVCAVGDDGQAIYRFRGADTSNVRGFQRHFPGAKVIKLEQNYRSTANILAAANAVIARNKNQIPKTLRTTALPGAPVRVHYVPDSDAEAQVVADTISEHVERGGRPDECAVLYRMNAQSRTIELSLRRASLPYVLIGGTAFFNRREVKDVLAYLRLVVNPASEEDFARALSVPPRGLGETTLDRLQRLGQQHDKPGARVFDLDDEALLGAGIQRRQLTRLRELGALLSGLRELASRTTAAQVARVLVEKVGYVEYLRKSDPLTAADREANVAELVSALGEVDTSLADADDSRSALDRALEVITLSSASDSGGEEGSVSLMTIHASKGLEFPVVFVVGMEEGTLPHLRAIEGDAEDIEEERRLAYVAMTRARDRLVLVSARERQLYGHTEIRAQSRYLDDLPVGVVEVRGTPPRFALRAAGGVG